MSYFPCDIPFMSKDELEANGIKIHKDSEEIKDTNMISKQQAIDSVLTLDVGNRVSWMDAVIDALDELPSFPHISSDTISRQDTIEAMEEIDWYHINEDGQLVHGANSKEDEPLYMSSDVYEVLNAMPSAQPDLGKYEYHYDHTDCIWYRPEARNRCPVTCAQYRDGWNDAMNYIFRDGKGYRPYRRGEQYEE